VKSYRADKMAAEADTIETVREIYRRSSGGHREYNSPPMRTTFAIVTLALGMAAAATRSHVPI
jgi:hypothetical protein